MDYAATLNLVLEGLVPIAWMERVARCDDPLHPRREELHPTDAERGSVVEVLVMADTLAAGGASTPREHEHRGRSLAALAKALVILAPCPGGVPFLGFRYSCEDVPDGGVRLIVRPEVRL